MEGLKMKRFFQIGLLAGLILIGIGFFIYTMKEELTRLPLAFLLSGAALILGYFVFNFEDIRKYILKRSIKYGANVTLLILIVFAVIFFVNVLASTHNKRLDLTEEKRYTLSPQTVKLLKSIPGDIEVICFYTQGNRARASMEELVSQYHYISKGFKYQFVDPERNPAKTKAYDIKFDGATIINYDKNTEKIVGVSEEELTNALIKVTRKEEKVIYFLEGHGEYSMEDYEGSGLTTLRESLIKQNYLLKKLVLPEAKKMPDDCNLLIVPSPKVDPFNWEIKEIESYIDSGGSALFLLEPFSTPKLARALIKYGFAVGDNVIVDRFSRVLGGDYLIPVVSSYFAHDITRGFKIMSFFPYARSVGRVKEPPERVTIHQLAQTSPESWGEVDEAALRGGRASFDPGSDLKGPVSLAAAAIIEPKREEENEEEESKIKARLVVFGDADFISNTYIAQQGNKDFILNAINWAAQQEELISIRAKNPRSTPVTLTLTQGKLIFFIPVVIMPMTIAILGLLVIRIRRRSNR
jgi:ABC-type uncharacterized transport system involved in gliding motility auxiliary subunit